MKLRSRRLERQPKLMIIPMIDIILFLLVFFMMSTMYMIEQTTMSVTLPQAHSAQTDSQNYVPVTVASNGYIYVGQEEIPLEVLGRRIQLELVNKPDATFVLRGDRQSQYGMVVTVMDQIKKAGVRRISVAVEPGGG